MKVKSPLIIFLTIVFHCHMECQAQFNTITDTRSINYEYLQNPNAIVESAVIETDTICINNDLIENIPIESQSQRATGNTSKDIVRKKHLAIHNQRKNLPSLTISNLVKEIRKNGIVHEKIVLAQAILETGWFTSSVCRNKNNLFGLTNPRTGQYYEFNHWTESVKAYYTKVQYRYKGGNYLLWLDKIGYAEDKTYVQSLIRLMKQYFM